MGHDKGNTKAKTSTKASLNAPRESAIKKDGEYFHLHFSLSQGLHLWFLMFLCMSVCEHHSWWEAKGWAWFNQWWVLWIQEGLVGKMPHHISLWKVLFYCVSFYAHRACTLICLWPEMTFGMFITNIMSLACQWIGCLSYIYLRSERIWL